MERRGIATERGDGNRAVAAQQQVVVALTHVRAEKAEGERVVQAIQARAATRQAEGWTAAQVAACQALEEQLGRPIDAAYLRQQRDAMAQRQHAARARMAVIHQAGQRVDAAVVAEGDPAQDEDAQPWAEGLAWTTYDDISGTCQGFRTAQKARKESSAFLSEIL